MFQASDISLGHISILYVEFLEIYGKDGFIEGVSTNKEVRSEVHKVGMWVGPSLSYDLLG